MCGVVTHLTEAESDKICTHTLVFRTIERTRWDGGYSLRERENKSLVQDTTYLTRVSVACLHT